MYPAEWEPQIYTSRPRHSLDYCSAMCSLDPQPCNYFLVLNDTCYFGDFNTKPADTATLGGGLDTVYVRIGK